MMEGELTESQIAAFLIALRMKGETITEITGVAKSLIGKAEKISTSYENVVDLCGTGGDSHGTFNISTTASFIVAGAGVPVAKHGNRSVSSPVGSADVLEQLGVNIIITKELAEKCLKDVGIVFLFAPIYHSAMRHVGKTRKEIGLRTVFNLIGPIVNPASVKNQVMGVYSEALIEPIAKVLRNLGSKRAMVVNGADAMDEVTITGKTSVAELKDGAVKTYKINPIDYGFDLCSLDDLKGGADSKANAEITLSILNDEEKGPKRDIAVMNASAAIYVSGVVDSFEEAISLSQKSIKSGKAMEKLNLLAEYTNK